jgi:beta-N-acetylhexosaminidase
MLAIAASSDPDATQGLARLVADHLEKMGFNLHLGPSLALAPTLPEVAGSIHCFGSNPEFVAASGQAFIETFADNGVIAMPMGFPGGGANRFRKGPAVLLTPTTVLAEQDLLPFSRAIEHGAPIIHVGNTLVPTLGYPDTPASICPAVIAGLLRQGLGFDGVIVAGPMDDPDIKQRHDASDAAILALKAGADMIYWNEAGQRVMKTVDEVVEAVADGTLAESTVNNALGRVLHVKVAYELGARGLPDPDAAKKLSNDRAIPRDSYRIERQSITLLLNRANVLPLSEESRPIGVTGVAGVEPLHDALEKHLKSVQMQPIVTARQGDALYDFEIRRVIARVPGLRTVVCVLSTDLDREGPMSMVRKLKAEVRQVVVVVVGYPRYIEDYLEADAVVVAYSDPEACEHSMQAVADVLVGRGPVRIRPPLTGIVGKAGQPLRFNALDATLCPAGRLPVTLDDPFVAGYAVHYDPSNTIKKIVWDFGDGKRSKKSLVEKAFKNPGTFPVTLTIRDKEDHVVTRTFDVVVE